MVTRWTAPAKLTVTLTVTGVRDDGYHLLESEMVALDLADTLEIDDSDDADADAAALEVSTAWPADSVARDPDALGPAFEVLTSVKSALDPHELVSAWQRAGKRAAYIPAPDDIVTDLAPRLGPGDVVLIMSNGGFGGIHEKLLASLRRSG